MKVFRIGDRVKLTNELLHYSANKHWSGKRGSVEICALPEDALDAVRKALDKQN